MSDVRYLSKKFIIEFIDLYKKLPSLWNLKCKYYYNRARKSADYDIMVEKMREIEPDATREMVTQKINSMRGSRRKEAAKIKQSIEEGGEVYIPKLWYYKLMDFVDGQESLTQAALREREKFSEGALSQPRESQIDTDVPDRWLSDSSTSTPNRALPESNNAPSGSDDAPVIAFTTYANPPKRQTKKRQSANLQTAKRQRGEDTNKQTHEAFGHYVARKL